MTYDEESEAELADEDALFEKYSIRTRDTDDMREQLTEFLDSIDCPASPDALVKPLSGHDVPMIVIFEAIAWFCRANSIEGFELPILRIMIPEELHGRMDQLVREVYEMLKGAA